MKCLLNFFVFILVAICTNLGHIVKILDKKVIDLKKRARQTHDVALILIGSLTIKCEMEN